MASVSNVTGYTFGVEALGRVMCSLVGNSGGSRISQTGILTYYLAKFARKLYENERIWTRLGDASLATLGSANEKVLIS